MARQGQVDRRLADIGDAKIRLFKALRDTMPDDYAGLVADRIEDLIRAIVASETDRRY